LFSHHRPPARPPLPSGATLSHSLEPMRARFCITRRRESVRLKQQSRPRRPSLLRVVFFLMWLSPFFFSPALKWLSAPSEHSQISSEQSGPPFPEDRFSSRRTIMSREGRTSRRRGPQWSSSCSGKRKTSLALPIVADIYQFANHFLKKRGTSCGREVRTSGVFFRNQGAHAEAVRDQGRTFLGLFLSPEPFRRSLTAGACLGGFPGRRGSLEKGG